MERVIPYTQQELEALGWLVTIAEVEGPVLQDKQVDITENGVETVYPDAGYNGMASVEVNTHVEAGDLENWLTDNGYVDQADHLLRLFESFNNVNQTATQWSDYYNNQPAPRVQPFFIRPVNAILIGALNYASNIFYIGGNLITEGVTSINGYYRNDTALLTFDVSDFPAVTDSVNAFVGCISLKNILALSLPMCLNASSMFSSCISLEELVITLNQKCLVNGLVSNCTNLRRLTINNGGIIAPDFYFDDFVLNCSNLSEINAIIDLSSVASLNRAFNRCSSLRTVHIHGLTNISINLSDSPLLSVESMVELFENANPATGTRYITLGAINIAKLTPEQINIATSKGYRVS